MLRKLIGVVACYKISFLIVECLHCVNPLHFVSPFNHPWAFGFLWLLVLVNRADTNANAQISFGYLVFSSFVKFLALLQSKNQRVLSFNENMLEYTPDIYNLEF